MTERKPRISVALKYSRYSGLERRWECYTLGVFGSGTTPTAAYDAWKHNKRMQAKRLYDKRNSTALVVNIKRVK